MKDIRAIFLDIDGTLINDDKEVGQFTINELKRVKTQYSVIVFFVSSRMPASITKLCDDIGVEGGIVAYNGAMISFGSKVLDYAPETSPLIDILSLEPFLIDLAQDQDVSLNIYKNDFWYTSNLGYWTLREIKSNKIQPNDVNVPLNTLSELKNGVHKILIRSNPDKLAGICQKLETLIGPDHNMLVAKPTLMEITSKNINKGIAVKMICEELKIDRDKVMAYGDGENDMEMIAYAGTGIVVENGISALKLIADEITLSNNEDGVGYSLSKYFPDKT